MLGRTLTLTAITGILISIQGAWAVTAQEYRQMADRSVASGQYSQAAGYYRSEAQIYRQHGDANVAAVEEDKADRWSTQLTLYIPAAADPHPGPPQFTGAKWEPPYGCYLGGYAEADDNLDGLSGPDGASLSREEALGQKTGKHLASAFVYSHYGEAFPVNWARTMVKAGIAPHIALEPNNGLDEVQDNDYLQQFAKDAADCGGPVFLRFASEMNGDWTNYHGNPALYREKFRLVHDVMNRLAPNVAMIWCVNSIPQQNITDYYPGDDAVDWVGVNFYSVLHHDNDPNRPSLFEHPASMMQYVYDHYSARKPIAICEYGASHREQLDPSADHSDAASAWLAELYAALPRRYPRVKMIDIFDCDNLTHARPGRQLSDYSITTSDAVLTAFRDAIAPDYYLSAVVDGNQASPPVVYAELTAGRSLSGTVRLSAWVKTYSRPYTVTYGVDGKEVKRAAGPGPCEVDLDTSAFSTGPHKLNAAVLDSGGHPVAAVDIPVNFEKAPLPSPATGSSSESSNKTAPGPKISSFTSAGPASPVPPEPGFVPARIWALLNRWSPVPGDPSALLFGVLGVVGLIAGVLFFIRLVRSGK